MKVTNSFYIFLTVSVSLFLLNGCSSEAVVVDNSGDPVSQIETQAQKTEAISEEKEMIVSREPHQGCSWEEFEATSIQLRFPLQKCKDFTHSFKVEGNSLVQYNHYSGMEDDDYKALEVFKKNEAQKPEEAIKAQFINKLVANEQENCLVKAETGMKKNSNEELYRIEPTEEYLDQLGKASEGPVEACGDYGSTNGIQYFLFKKDHPEMFVFVRIGQDTPLFDEQNITFLDQ